MTAQASTYVTLGALPILTGLACIARPFVQVVYGSQYLPAIPVFIVMALLSFPKAFMTPAQTLLCCTEDVGFMLKSGLIAAVLNIALDIALIPGHGALGAAYGNGIGQAFAAVAIWARVLHRHPVRLETSVLLRVCAATTTMAAVVLTVIFTSLSPATKIAVAVPLGVIVFMITSRLFMVLQGDDRRRLLTFSASLPAPVAASITRVVDFLVPASL
jgi:O-antigen/teichoic acid export membrane protein